MIAAIEEIVSNFLIDVTDFACNDDLGHQFSAGTFRVIEELDTLLVGIFFIAFGDIGGDGNGSTPHLIS